MGKKIWIASGVVAAAVGITAIVAHAERGGRPGDEGGYGRHGQGYGDEGGYGRHGQGYGDEGGYGRHGHGYGGGRRGFRDGDGERGRGWRGFWQREMTKDDFDAETRARFARWDANGDGVVDKAEVEAKMKSRMERRSGRRSGGHMSRQMRRIDADRDGKVTKAEVEAFVTKRMQRMDLDGDGRITDADLPPMMRDRGILSGDASASHGVGHGRGGHRGGGRMMRHLHGADTNKDGAVTLQELQDRATQRFQRFDRTKDGSIDQADRDALRAELLDYRVRRKLHRFGAGVDGKLTLEQFKKHRDERFAMRDADGDGVLERGEGHGGRGHGGGPGRGADGDGDQRPGRDPQ